MSLSIHHHGLHLDVQYGQTWHLLTQLRIGDRVVGFCGQPHYCNRPYYPTAWFWSPSSYMVSAEPFPNGSRSMSCKLAQMGPSSIIFLWLWPVTDHEPHCRHVSIDEIWRRTESTPRSGWWLSHMAGIYSDCSTREIKMNWQTSRLTTAAVIAARGGSARYGQRGLSSPESTSSPLKLQLW